MALLCTTPCAGRYIVWLSHEQEENASHFEVWTTDELKGGILDLVKHADYVKARLDFEKRVEKLDV